MLADTRLLFSSPDCEDSRYLNSKSCGKYQFNMPFIVVVSGSNGCVLVVSWDVENSRPDLMEGDKAVKPNMLQCP